MWVKNCLKQHQDLSRDELSEVEQMRDEICALATESCAEPPARQSAANTSTSTHQEVQGLPNLISYPEQHQTLSKEVQEPQPACLGLNLPSSTSGLFMSGPQHPLLPQETITVHYNNSSPCFPFKNLT